MKALATFKDLCETWQHSNGNLFGQSGTSKSIAYHRFDRVSYTLRLPPLVIICPELTSESSLQMFN